MASESPDVVVVAPVVENGGAESSNGKDEQLESELSKKLEIAEDGKEDNDEDEGSKGETSTKKKKKNKSKKKKELPQQTNPPSIPVVELFPSGEFPEVICGEQHLKRRESWSVWKSQYITLFAKLQKFIAKAILKWRTGVNFFYNKPVQNLGKILKKIDW
ncbi:methionine aminopeptidase 2B isoform X2 [Arabidopsis lyrata subsp. lyrata]|uniref:methionine aminopeptidase 2B isoform X2 n=1 Tax=Arabidopsis lyrata subsp. lyrata TaxID=81972 RepID=UPI000A29E955|nr:methionine aminopeptidase 2B isoform X2 [Arabidopsis lyrata subsp. lyrata]|eukprot:XP_020870604.1 methionine aminopeptidase 2B isoform X2 [Arabidopsis lyrata subsp. lyrata]